MSTLPMPPAVRQRLLVAGVLVILEGLAMLALAVADLTDITGERMALGLGSTLLLGLYATAQLVAATQLLRGRLGARGLIVMTQLIQLGLAWNLRDAELGDTEVPGLPWLLAGTAIAVLVAVLSPTVGRFAEEQWEHDSPE